MLKFESTVNIIALHNAKVNWAGNVPNQRMYSCTLYYDLNHTFQTDHFLQYAYNMLASSQPRVRSWTVYC